MRDATRLEDILVKFDAWCDECRGAATWTTLGMVQDKLRELVASAINERAEAVSMVEALTSVDRGRLFRGGQMCPSCLQAACVCGTFNASKASDG